MSTPELDTESEFQLIQRFFIKNKSKNKLSVITKGIGDDAAVIDISQQANLVISMDTLISGVHFPKSTKPYDIAYKSLAVNLSDLAAMGATPSWFTLALTLPGSDSEWLSEFSRGLFELASDYDIDLVGGDTTQSVASEALSITIQIAGYVSDNNIMYRNRAQVDDDIYVSGYLGDAGAGLLLSNETVESQNTTTQYLLNRLNRPSARVTLGEQLRHYGTACIDVSDGLLADLQHIISSSQCGAEIEVNYLPISNELKSSQFAQECLDLALSSGDDYELCFCVPKKYRLEIQNISDKLNIPITRIGKIIKGKIITCQTDNKPYYYKKTGYKHFNTKESNLKK